MTDPNAPEISTACGLVNHRGGSGKSRHQGQFGVGINSQRALSWNRSRIGACSCGVELAMSEPRPVESPLEIQFAIWVGRRITRRSEEIRLVSHLMASEMARPEGLTALMTLLWPLSLDGGLHIAYALGTAECYEDQLLRPTTF